MTKTNKMTIKFSSNQRDLHQEVVPLNILIIDSPWNAQIDSDLIYIISTIF